MNLLIFLNLKEHITTGGNEKTGGKQQRIQNIQRVGDYFQKLDTNVFKTIFAEFMPTGNRVI